MQKLNKIARLASLAPIAQETVWLLSLDHAKQATIVRSSLLLRLRCQHNLVTTH